MLALNPTKQLIATIKLAETEIFSLPFAEQMFSKLVHLSSLLQERGIAGSFTINDHVITMEWVNENVVCNFAIWPEYGDAQFVAFKFGEEVFSQDFSSIEEFESSYYEVLNEVPV
jgi:hypothetical protein